MPKRGKITFDEYWRAVRGDRSISHQSGHCFEKSQPQHCPHCGIAVWAKEFDWSPSRPTHNVIACRNSLKESK